MYFIVEFSLHSSMEDKFLSKLILSVQIIFNAIKLSRLRKGTCIWLVNEIARGVKLSMIEKVNLSQVKKNNESL